MGMTIYSKKLYFLWKIPRLKALLLLNFHMSPLFWKKQDSEWSHDISSDVWVYDINISNNTLEDVWEEVGQLSLDILENREWFFILAPLAGIKLEDIDISVHDDTLIISGIRNKPKEFFDYGIEVKNEECFWWQFQRKVIFPDNVDFSSVKAVMENNLLVVSLPKIRFSGKHIRIEHNS